MKSLIGNNTNRRKFFSLAGKGTLSAMILSSFPLKLIASTGNYKKLKKVVIHNQAVKRVK